MAFNNANPKYIDTFFAWNYHDTIQDEVYCYFNVSKYHEGLGWALFSVISDCGVDAEEIQKDININKIKHTNRTITEDERYKDTKRLKV